jgi:hypothetical protein
MTAHARQILLMKRVVDFGSTIKAETSGHATLGLSKSHCPCRGGGPVAGTIGWAAALLIFIAVTAAGADDTSAVQSQASSSSPLVDYFKNWFERASKTQAEQPHWVTPLATVTPRLEQELRYDQLWQALPGGHSLDNYGGGKGLELIPAEPLELIIGIPAWETENTSPRKEGWADQTFLVKYRILSANEDNGDYILTAFMGLSVPNGSAKYTSGHYAFTPTVAYGEGWGRFDFQSTLSVSIPDNGGERSGAGTPILFNTAFQYHVDRFLWPELEANYTYWPNGKHEGLNQLFLTPGLLLGRFPIFDRVGVTIGVGCQIAVTDSPLMHRNIILSARIPF